MKDSLFFSLRTFGQTTQLIIAIMCGVLLGIFSLLVTPLWTLAILLGLVSVIAAIKRPEFALLAILALLSSVVADTRIPVINIGTGRIYITEPIVISLFIVILVRWLIEPNFKLAHTPLDLPILLFFGWAILSTIVALLQSQLQIELMIPEVRIVSYYLIFFTITNLITKERNLKLLIEGFFFLATLVSITVIIQYVFGVTTLILAGRVEALWTAGRAYGDVTRITDIVGEGTITVAIITKVVMLFISKPRFKGWVEFIQWLIIGTAFVMNFNRAHWTAAIGVGLLTVFLVRGIDRQRFITWLITFLLLLPLVYIPIIINPDEKTSKFITASFDRLRSIVTNETLRGSSYVSTITWRNFEYQYAFPQIMNHPLLGLGLGARYRPMLAEIDHPDFDGRHFIHNGHVWVMLKTGLVGYFFLMWFCIARIARGFKYWRLIPDSRLRGYFMGFTLSFLALMFIATLHTTFMVLYWTPVIALSSGVNEVMIKLYVPNQKPA